MLKEMTLCRRMNLLSPYCATFLGVCGGLNIQSHPLYEEGTQWLRRPVYVTGTTTLVNVKVCRVTFCVHPSDS